MPYREFDTSKLRLKSLSERVHDVNIASHDSKKKEFIYASESRYDELAERIISAYKKNATVLMMYGAHVIRTGNASIMIEMMKNGLITHFATNGAGAIHDFELSLIGATCESVTKYISEGQFGLWKETGYINEAIKIGRTQGLGFGEAVGKYIWENNFPYKKKSVLAMGYHLQVPCTVHVGIGNDIIHEHPNFNGEATGAASYKDFLIYVENICNLENGVFLNFGSAVTGPEVYLKALAMARNVANQENRVITDFTTAVFDLIPLGGDTKHTPTKENPNYYFRPWKTILARTVADGGKSYYICGDHQCTIPNLFLRTLSLKGK